MSNQIEILPDNVDRLYNKLNREAASGGYHLNPEAEITKELVKGLLVNEKRYGYPSCPCRMTSGNKDEDLDIICPCDYRDPDVTDYGTCYCGLYVSQAVVNGEEKVRAIPERRPPPEKRKKLKSKEQEPSLSSLPLPVWRCRVCGYLCAREEPPEICPICKAKKERFARFI